MFEYIFVIKILFNMNTFYFLNSTFKNFPSYFSKNQIYNIGMKNIMNLKKKFHKFLFLFSVPENCKLIKDILFI